MNVTNTYEVSLYMGSRIGYDGDAFTEKAVIETIGQFQAESPIQIPVRVTRTHFVDGNYNEPGWQVTGLVYPSRNHRPDEVDDFMAHLARYLLKRFQQKRITVVAPTHTYMFEEV